MVLMNHLVTLRIGDISRPTTEQGAMLTEGRHTTGNIDHTPAKLGSQ